MKVLWIVNTVFPEAARHVGLPVPVVGGWMYGLASDLTRSGEVQLAVASVYGGSSFLSFSIEGVHYYLVPDRQKAGVEVQHWLKMIDEFVPEIVHIHGTEYGHGMKCMRIVPNMKYVISIQGLVSVYHRYYLSGMTLRDVVSSITLRDALRWDTLLQAREKFRRRGLVELEYIRSAWAIVGRTDWDFDHVNAVRPGVPYYFCNESLRDEFYCDESWKIDHCKRNSLFLSQASYPIKGLHQVLRAVALLKPDFPDINIEIAGGDITVAGTPGQRLRLGGYGKFIRRLLDELDLWSHVRFLGQLNAGEMKQAYLRAHAFVCPSSIENSPNSLGEAQMLGVPSVAAYVGGIPSMVNDGRSALLYRFEEHEMLASKLRDVFTNDVLAQSLSQEGALEANDRHDRSSNAKNMLCIYKKALPV